MVCKIAEVTDRAKFPLALVLDWLVIDRLIDEIDEILQSFLTSEASTAVKDLLPGSAGGDLAETCSWADRQRFRYKWSSPLHFADTPGDCKFSYARTYSRSRTPLNLPYITQPCCCTCTVSD